MDHGTTDSITLFFDGSVLRNCDATKLDELRNGLVARARTGAKIDVGGWCPQGLVVTVKGPDTYRVQLVEDAEGPPL